MPTTSTLLYFGPGDMVSMVATAIASDGRQKTRRPRDQAEELALMLVRDWLERSAFHATVQAFDIEGVRLDRLAPQQSKREALLELLLHAIPDAHKYPAAPVLRTLLESLLAQRLGPTKKLSVASQPPWQQPTILMSKKKVVDCDQRVVKKSNAFRSRGSSSTPELVAQPSPNNRPDAGFRPKSAITCRSTPELVSLSGSQPGLKRPLRPISAASTLSHRTNLSSSPTKIQPGSPILLGAVMETPETRSPKSEKSMTRCQSLKTINGPSARHFSNVAVGALPQITDTNIAVSPDESDDEKKPKETETTLLLEEMSEELLMSQYSSLSKEAIKTIRRVRAKSNAYNQEFEKSKRTIGKIQAREKQRQLRRVLAAEQTELLSSAMDGLTKEPCGLCEFVFPKKSLIMRVTYKAIFDLRSKWSVSTTASNGDLHLPNRSASDPKCRESGGGNDGERGEEDSGDRSQIAHFYDEVPICVFCKQLLLDVSFYRPSSAEMRVKQAETARAAAEEHQLKEAARVRALHRCDPLDFHAFELNSEDGDSDTEELLVLDVDGRTRVVRRKKTAKIKVVANRGLVGKHLHYNQLRSESVHTLNNKEWQQITS